MTGVEIRPTRRAHRAPLEIVVWGAFVTVNLVAGRLAYAGLAAAATVVTLAGLHLWRRRATLVLAGDTLRRRGIVRTRTVARQPVRGRAVTSEVLWSSGRRSGWWSLLDGDGRALLGLDLTAWEPADLTALAKRLGVPEERDPTPRRPAELREAYPGTLPWAIAHPVRLTFATVVVMFAAGFLAAGLYPLA